MVEVHAAGWLLVVWLVLGLHLLMWGQVCRRWRQGQPLVAWSPRRRVPWNGWGVLAVLTLHLSVVLLFAQAMRHFLGETGDAPPQAAATARTDESSRVTPHPLVQLVNDHRDAPLMLILSALIGVVWAPLVEEFLFRVVLQGWLERAERRWRRTVGRLRQVPHGLLSVLLSASIFAALHVRGAGEQIHTDSLLPALLASGLGGMAALALGMFVLHEGWQARGEDLGWGERAAVTRVLPELGLGLAALAWVLLPVYLVQGIALWALAEVPLAPDPIPLFLMGLALGYLYLRTHRIWAPLALHVGFNLVALLAVWFSRAPTG